MPPMRKISLRHLRSFLAVAEAGSFTVADNAYRLSAKLQPLGKTEVLPAMVRGTQFYRVRVGPVASVEQGDALLARVLSSGSDNAIIIVE